MLHGPLTPLFVVLLSPSLFVFDWATLWLLHRGLSSRRRVYEFSSGAVCVLLIVLSGSFVSFYEGSKSGLDWSHAIEVLSHGVPAKA